MFIFMLFILSAFLIEAVTVLLHYWKWKNMFQLIYTRSTHYVALPCVYSILHYFVILELKQSLIFCTWTIFEKIKNDLSHCFKCDTQNDFLKIQLKRFINKSYHRQLIFLICSHILLRNRKSCDSRICPIFSKANSYSYPHFLLNNLVFA
jgi:hypothetical protein